jgi:type I restriction enzyme S subunit
MKETKFKQTEVGMIPCDWEVVRLNDSVMFLDSQRIPIKDSDRKKMTGHYPYYGASGIIDYVDKYIFDDDLILLGEDGANIIDRSSELAFVIHGKCWINNHAHVLKPNEDFNIDYLANYLESLKYDQYNTGTAQPKLNRDKCGIIPIVKPPLEEQKLIAQALSDVDAVISTTEKLVAKKKALKQGTMQTLLSGKMRIQNGKWIKTTHFKQTELGPIPQEWEVKSLGSITQNSSYGVGAEAIPFNGKAKYIRITDIDDDSHRFEPSPLTSPAFYENKHLVQENDLLIARTGASVGKTYLYNAKDGKLVFAGFLIKMNICGADSKFVFYSTLTKYYQDWIVSESARTGQPGVNLQQMKKLLIAIPSSKAEQTAIATVLSDMDSEIAALETKLAKYRQLKTGMMQQLLTGKVRLVSKGD